MEKNYYNLHPTNDNISPVEIRGPYLEQFYYGGGEKGESQTFKQPQYPENPQKTYSSVLRGGVVDSNLVSTDQQRLTNRYSFLISPTQYSDLLGGYESFARTQNQFVHASSVQN